MMSASQKQDFQLDDLVMPGAPVPPVVERGEFDPRAIHYGYSAGEHELLPRAADTGYASILPGLLVPLILTKKRVPNDTMDALQDEKAPQSIEREVTPRDKADALMSRYQHRGFRIFMPLIGMDQTHAMNLFRVVHPPMPCERRPERLNAFDQRIVKRHCVACRLEDLRSDKSLDRIEQAQLSGKPTIEYGRDDSGDVRVISLQEAALFMHEAILSGLEEHYNHMIDTLQQSKADVEAGRHGPGKKKFDKRDEWYFLMSHKSPNDIEAIETVMRAQGSSLASDVGRAVSEAMRQGNGGGLSLADVEKLIRQREAAIEKRIEERMRKEYANKGKGKDREKPEGPEAS